MKHVRNEKGIALVTALMFTLICLAMIMTLLYYVLTGTKMSTAQKKYKNALEATYGGSEFVTKTVIPQLFTDFSSARTALNKVNEVSDLNLKFAGPETSSKDALNEKLFNRTASWSAGVSKTVDPKTVPDFVFTLKGVGGTDYRVYSKIIDTVPATGMLDAGVSEGLETGAGVIGTTPSVVSQRTPAIYTVEVQGEAAVNPKEKAGVMVLYAY